MDLDVDAWAGEHQGTRRMKICQVMAYYTPKGKGKGIGKGAVNLDAGQMGSEMWGAFCRGSEGRMERVEEKTIESFFICQPRPLGHWEVLAHRPGASAGRQV